MKVTGAAEMIAKFRRLKQGLPREIGAALYQETQVETTEVKKRTPVWNPERRLPRGMVPGALRATVRNTEPGLDGTTLFCLIVAGGPEAPYAPYVHENLDDFHVTGEAKFIESVIGESRPFMLKRVAARIDFNRAAS